MSFIEKVMDLRVEPDLLKRVSDAVELERATDDPAPYYIIAIRELSADTADPVTIAAVVFRMEALARLIQRKAIGKWTISVLRQEHVLVPEAVFVAASRAPLHVSDDGKSVDFHTEEFLTLALAASEPEGRS